MAALDTNAVTRLLVGDDAAQAAAAENFVAVEPCTVKPSVAVARGAGWPKAEAS